MKKTVVLAIALVAGSAAPAAAGAIDPVDIFIGRSHGHGTLKVILKSPQEVDVDNVGKMLPNGEIVLTQTVNDHSSKPRTRYWHIRKVSPTQYTGTMDDAVGPVSITINGNRARLAYTDHDGNRFDQQLQAVSSREVVNVLKVHRYGLVVARMTETIRKLD